MLLQESIEALAIRQDGLYIDATFGRGGHSQAILKRLSPDGRLLVIDKDPQAIEQAELLAKNDARVIVRYGSYARLQEFAEGIGWTGKVHGILLDLGVSSPQLDQAERGFSFLRDGPLDMRMDNLSGRSAADWLAVVGETELADVLWRYGEERFSRRIAKAISTYRVKQAITRTQQLAQIIADAIPRHEFGKNPATRSFQAIRIYLNRELEELEAVLPQAVNTLTPGGRLAVISFHSLEDRLVKQFIREKSSKPAVPRGLPIKEVELVKNLVLKELGKPIRAGEEELKMNARARSATLRIAEKI